MIAGCLVVADRLPLLTYPLRAVGALALSVYTAQIVVLWALLQVDPVRPQGVDVWLLFVRLGPRRGGPVAVEARPRAARAAADLELVPGGRPYRRRRPTACADAQFHAPSVRIRAHRQEAAGRREAAVAWSVVSTAPEPPRHRGAGPAGRRPRAPGGARAQGAEAVPVRRPEELAGVDGLVLPGGESTTMVKLAARFGLLEPLRAAVARAGCRPTGPAPG